MSEPDEYQPRSGTRFKGPFSPGAARTDATTARPPSTRRTGGVARPNLIDRQIASKAPQRGKTTLIGILAFPLVISGLLELLTAQPLDAIRDFFLYGLFIASLGVLRTGLDVEAEYDRREFASPPSFPRKIIGSIGLGVSVLATSLLGWDAGLVQSLGFGLLAGAASLWAFGLDPMKGKGYTTSTGVTPQQVIETLDEAHGKLNDVEASAAEIADRGLRDRLRRVVARGRDILDRIEKDPSDLRRARKFLVVYLDGARDATRKYARSQHDLGAGSSMYIKFRSLLDDMEREFDHQYEKLLTNDRIDLDVEIDVLAERLKRESAL